MRVVSEMKLQHALITVNAFFIIKETTDISQEICGKRSINNRKIWQRW